MSIAAVCVQVRQWESYAVKSVQCPCLTMEVGAVGGRDAIGGGFAKAVFVGLRGLRRSLGEAKVMITCL